MNQIKAKIGDTIICQGRKATISKIITQYNDNGYLGVEGYDTNNKYFMWKQCFDEGVLRKANECQ